MEPERGWRGCVLRFLHHRLMSNGVSNVQKHNFPIVEMILQFMKANPSPVYMEMNNHVTPVSPCSEARCSKLLLSLSCHGSLSFQALFFQMLSLLRAKVTENLLRQTACESLRISYHIFWSPTLLES
jgi:hypothetical protein